MDLPNPSQMKAFAYPNNIYRQKFLKLKIIYLPKVKKTIQSLFFKGLASYCKAETTFTFHLSILTL